MLARRFQPRRNAEDRTNEKGGIARWEKENVGLKKKKKDWNGHKKLAQKEAREKWNERA